MTTRRERTSAQSRDLILGAAAELFAEKGYRQTTFVDVAERSGISRGSIPWHFGSKEGLLLAVLERSVSTFRSGLATDTAADTAAVGDVEAGFDGVAEGLRALVAQPTSRLFVTLLVEALEPDSPIHDRYVEIQQVMRDHCATWLARFPLPAGLSAQTLATVVLGAGIGIHQQWLVAPERVDPVRALAALRAMVVALVAAG